MKSTKNIKNTSVVTRSNIINESLNTFLTNDDIKKLASTTKISFNDEVRRYKTDNLFSIFKYKNIEELIIDLHGALDRSDIAILIRDQLPKLKYLHLVNYDIEMEDFSNIDSKRQDEIVGVFETFEEIDHCVIGDQYIIDNVNKKLYFTKSNCYQSDSNVVHTVFDDYEQFVILDDDIIVNGLRLINNKEYYIDNGNDRKYSVVRRKDAPYYGV